MKKALINYAKSEKCDIFQTPFEAIFPILKYIPNDVKTIWECCDPGWSIISKVLKDNGYQVISTDIETGFDFLKRKAEFHFDMIITNPPFSLKTQFLRKCFEYQKHFALLLPLTALEGKERQEFYKNYGINIILFNERINFIQKKKGAWFATAWFFWHKNGENNRIFYDSLYKEQSLIKKEIVIFEKRQQNLFP